MREVLDGVDDSQFDVFVCHNGSDKPSVRRLVKVLQEKGVKAWLDEEQLRPGMRWQDSLDEVIEKCRSAIVCVGETGLGPWEQAELNALLRRFVDDRKHGGSIPVIPVLLPGAPGDVVLPIYLQMFTFVDLRDGLKPLGIDRLTWGITGMKSK